MVPVLPPLQPKFLRKVSLDCLILFFVVFMLCASPPDTLVMIPPPLTMMCGEAFSVKSYLLAGKLRMNSTIRIYNSNDIAKTEPPQRREERGKISCEVGMVLIRRFITLHSIYRINPRRQDNFAEKFNQSI